jgi:chromosome segregation ATPase
MSIIVGSLGAILIVGLAAFLYIQLRNQHRTQGLSLSDKTDIAKMAMSLGSLIMAVISLYIAINSYQSAQQSGRQQQQTLNASKDSLLSVVDVLKNQQSMIEDSRHALRQSIDIITAQKDLLQQSVETSRNQLSVLDAQWKRQLEQPDIHAALVYPAKPAVLLINKSNIKPVKDGLYQLITLNIDRWLGVRDCNRNGSGLQSPHFWDRIICLYPSPQDRIICL